MQSHASGVSSLAADLLLSSAFILLTPPALAVSEPSNDATGHSDARIGAAVVQASLGRCIGDPGFDANADFNGDGCVNVLDAAILGRTNGQASLEMNSGAEPGRETARPQNAAMLPEQIIIVEPSIIAQPRERFSVLFLIRSNVTPLLGYSVDVDVVPEAGSIGVVTADVASTNFFEGQNLITGGASPCAALDPVFSLVLDGGDGGVFINAITDDNSACQAVDNVNDVLAQVFFVASQDACGEFTIQLGPASALSDANAFPVAFDFTPGIIVVENCLVIPTASTWGVAAMSLLLLSAGTIFVRRRVPKAAVGAV